MTVEFLDQAEEEIVEAALWYDEREPGLGRRLRDEVQRLVRRIASDPLRPQLRRGGYRRVNCAVFPYYIAYFIRGERILIAAVAHGFRKPEYWKSRLKNPPHR